MTLYEKCNLALYGLSALVALGMLGVALHQLRELVRQVKAAVVANSIARLNALLSLEEAIAERRLRLSEAGISLAEIAKSGGATRDDVTVAQLRLDEAIQMYLNALDRLCFCLLRGLLEEEELRAEYREVINAAVKDFAGKFNTGTEYRNVKKVYEKWADH